MNQKFADLYRVFTARTYQPPPEDGPQSAALAEAGYVAPVLEGISAAITWR